MNYGMLKRGNRPFIERFLNQTRIIVLSFIAVILVGALLLSLPFSHHGKLSFLDALFTATSATCVTGLSTISLSTKLTLGGQIVVLLLMQVGGMGFMTLASSTFVLVGKKLSMRKRLNMRDYLAENDMSEFTRIAINVIKFTFITELFGAILLTIAFSRDFSFGTALFYGIFHTVAAFCNSGFDVIPHGESLGSYTYQPFVLLVLAVLIILGGLGFIVIGDVAKVKRWKKLRIDSKIVLVMTGALLFIGTALFMLTDYDGALGGMSFGHKLCNAFFLSASTRTAGFATVAIKNFTPVARNIMVVLMFIGVAPGSTGGGIKVTTTFVLLVWIIAHLRQKKDTVIGMKKVGSEVKSKAATIIVLALITITLALTVMLAFDGNNFTTEELMFETVSAYATVGLSMGITSALSVGSKIVVIIVMFMGRVGAYTLFVSAIRKAKNSDGIKYPELNVMM